MIHMLREERSAFLIAAVALVVLCPMVTVAGINGVKIDTGADRVKTPLKVSFTRVGTLVPRHARDIRASNWLVGCETLDRDYCNFDEYKEYIGPLGAKMVRLQGGWWKTERVKGRYDFAWLDKIVDYLRENGVEIFMELSYGNPNYEGGGGWDLSAGFPVGPEGFEKGWLGWVDAMTKRYADKVAIWAIWNEPDIVDPATPGGAAAKTPAVIGEFNARTARVIRRNIPRNKGKIAGMALARNDAPFLGECLAAMGEDVKLLDIVIYHGYDYAPEESYPNVLEQKAMVARFLPEAELMQGENGCPSEMTLKFALPHVAWSEYSQAKWNMRRMLGDLGHDVRGNVFTITDFNHTRREVNLKGLIRANANRETIGIKRSFYAVQNVISVFDDTLTRVKGSLAVSTTDRTLQLYEYRKPDGAPVFVFWRAAAGMHEYTPETIFDHTKAVVKRTGPHWTRPGDSFETSPGVFAVTGTSLIDPVWVDLFTGAVYEIPKANCLTYSGGVTYTDIPVYDSPCLLTERRVVLPERESAVAADDGLPTRNPGDLVRFFWGIDRKYPYYRDEMRRSGFNLIVDAWNFYDYTNECLMAEKAARVSEMFRVYKADNVDVLVRPSHIPDGEGTLDSYKRIFKDGKVNRRNIDAARPELWPHWTKAVEAYGHFFANEPACAGVQTISEVRDNSHPSFTTNTAIAYRAATGREIPSEVEGRAAPHWSRLAGIPADRVIDEDHPVLAFYRWFWKKGDGWNDYQTLVANAFTRAYAEKGRKSFSFYDPSQRVPPLWGSGGGVDCLNHWTYIHPQPFNVSYVVSQQNEMAKPRGQKVWTMLQGMVYRNKTAPAEEKVANPPTWVALHPKTKYLTTPPDLMREGIWSALSRRIDGIGFYGFNSLYDVKPVAHLCGFGDEHTNPETKDVVAELMRDVAVPLGPFLRAAPELESSVAVLESYASSILSGAAPWDWTCSQYHYGVLATAANLSPEALYEEDIAANGVPMSVKVLLLPNCAVLTKGAAAAVRAFRARGGKLVGEKDLCPGVGAPDSILPEFVRENRQTGDQAEDVLPGNGRGMTGRADDLNFRETVKHLREVVLQFVTPVADARGEYLLTHARSAGAGADVLFVINDKRTYGDYVGPWRRVLEKGAPNVGTAILSRPARAVYDLVRHEPVTFRAEGAATEIDVSFETNDGRAYLVCDRPLSDLRLAVDRDEFGTRIVVTTPDRDTLVPVELNGLGDGPVSAVVKDGTLTRYIARELGVVTVRNLADGKVVVAPVERKRR